MDYVPAEENLGRVYATNGRRIVSRVMFENASSGLPRPYGKQSRSLAQYIASSRAGSCSRDSRGNREERSGN